jgi:MFS family permease
LACVRKQFSPPEQGLPTGILTSGMIAGPAVGALLGSLLITRFGWRALFILTGLGSCLWLLPWFRSAPDDTGGSVSKSRLPQGTMAIAHLFQLRPVWAITIGAFFYSYYCYFCLTWLPSYLTMSRHVSYLKMGMVTSVPFAVLSVISPAAGWSSCFESGFKPHCGFAKDFIAQSVILLFNVLRRTISHTAAGRRRFSHDREDSHTQGRTQSCRPSWSDSEV